MKKTNKTFHLICLTTLFTLGNMIPAAAFEDTSDSVFSSANQEISSHIVAIDPGHQEVSMDAAEPNGPGSSEMKMQCTGGTRGSFSNLPEYQLNLDVSLALKAELEERGYEVKLTRDNNNAQISNKERAEYANRCGAEIFVRIHANGSEDASVHGAITMYPSPTNPYVSELSDQSHTLSECIITSYCEKTGIDNLGTRADDTMTGMNWSEIPVTIVEMGHMTNQEDDLKMADPDFQVTMAEGIADGIDAYFAAISESSSTIKTSSVFGNSCEPAPESETSDVDHSGEGQLHASSEKKSAALPDTSALDALNNSIQQKLNTEVQGNGSWSVCVYDLKNGISTTVGTTGRMQAASLIKLYIMGAVYESYESLCQTYSSDAIDGNLTPMITVSDNTAANNLVSYLGGGDSAAGMNVVNSFCQKNGYYDTHMGRLLLASNALDDNYTSTADCGKILSSIYKNSSDLSHTQDMLNLLCQQQRRNKIPAGLPLSNCTCGNKTGELGDVENDAAIVFNTPNNDFVLCVMSENLSSPGNAQASIASIAQLVYSTLNP